MNFIGRTTNIAKLRNVIQETRQSHIKSEVKNKVKVIAWSAKQLLEQSYLQNTAENTYFDDNGESLVKIFVRKINTFQWLFVENFQINEYGEIKQRILMDEIQEGGLDSEIIRANLDQWIAKKVFGRGLGDALIIDKVKEKFPKYKTLKSKQLQFGYRLSNDNDLVSLLYRSMARYDSALSNINSNSNYESVEPLNISSLLINNFFNSSFFTSENNKLKKNIDEFEVFNNSCLQDLQAGKTIENLFEIPNDSLVTKLLMKNLNREENNHLYSNIFDSNFLNFFEKLKNFAIFCTNKNITNLLIASDGSAVMNGTSCVNSASGLIFIPLSVNNDKENKAEAEILINNKIINNKSNNNNKSYSGLMKAKTKNDLDFQYLNESLLVRIANAQSFVSTPFDSELLGGFAVTSVLNLFVKFFYYERYYNVNKKESKIPLKFVFVTDSRKLCKLLNFDLNSDEISNLKEKQFFNRILFSKFLRFNIFCVNKIMNNFHNNLTFNDETIEPYSSNDDYNYSSLINSNLRSSFYNDLYEKYTNHHDDLTCILNYKNNNEFFFDDHNKNFFSNFNNNITILNNHLNIEWTLGHPERIDIDIEKFFFFFLIFIYFKS
jgi:hypothetical protein